MTRLFRGWISLWFSLVQVSSLTDRIVGGGVGGWGNMDDSAEIPFQHFLCEAISSSFDMGVHSSASSQPALLLPTAASPTLQEDGFGDVAVLARVDRVIFVMGNFPFNNKIRFHII